MALPDFRLVASFSTNKLELYCTWYLALVVGAQACRPANASLLTLRRSVMAFLRTFHIVPYPSMGSGQIEINFSPVPYLLAIPFVTSRNQCSYIVLVVRGEALSALLAWQLQ